MPGTVVLEDDGLFILAAWFNGVAHPPGYPLYTLLAYPIVHLPGTLTVAGKAHALSALFGSLACSMIALITLELTASRLAALVAGISYGVSEVFWSQSIIAEVYSLNSFLFFLAVWLCLRFSKEGNRSYILYAVAFVIGLGLANHWPLIVLSSPMLLGVLWPWRWATLRTVGIALLFLILGLSPYLWMVIRSQMNPLISFYGPIDSLYEFWFVISRAGYAGVDHSATAGWLDKWQFLQFFARQFAAQFGGTGFILVVVGLFSQLRYWRLPVAIGMLVAFLANTILLIVLLGFDYDLFHRLIFRVYPHIAYGIAAIWLGAGFLIVAQYLTTRLSVNKVIIWGMAVLITGVGLLTNLPLNYRANDTWAEKYARAVLDNLEPDAVIFTHGEVTTAPLAYLNLIERYRPDVEIFNGQGLLLANRLYSFNEPEEVKKQKNDQFIEQNDRPIFYMGDFANSYANYHYGLFLEVNKSLRENVTVYRKDPKVQTDLLALLATVPQDAWQNMTWRLLIIDYCRLSFNLLLTAVEFGSIGHNSVAPYCRTYQAYLMMMDTVVNRQDIEWRLLKILIDEAAPLADQSMDKHSRSLLEYYRGVYLQATGDTAAATSAWRIAMRIWPNPENLAVEKCRQFEC